MAYFNPSLKSIVSTDASKYGLGAIQLEGEQSICYTSWGLNDTQ